ncbi:hypothetical protein E2562_037110 [Oryza meyeriana var. granulata]|uniref:Uncharacterized protein n=1 Tax=Oryza meyeriana var. granulata TaxID=110450 RepID=A0A6G1E6Q2_9ORYZ|nr:hypothetical protein E2562_037110 [Oryza meyeriana var. granulata]
MGRGSLMVPSVGLPRPPPAAPPVSSIQAGTAAGRAGPAHGRPGQAADGQPAGAQAARPQATADHCPPASSSRKRPLAAKKKDEQEQPFDLDSEYVDGENNAQGDPFDANQEGDEEVQEVTPTKKKEEITIPEIMEHVKDCGAAYGSDEHDIATHLFVKKEHREIAGARLRAKQVYLLQKLYSGAALWWSWWSKAGKGGAEQS